MDVLHAAANFLGWRTENTSIATELILLFARIRNYVTPGLLLVVGHWYLDYCSGDNRIPIYLIIGGALGVIQMVLAHCLDLNSFRHVHGLVEFAHTAFSMLFLIWYFAGYYVIWYMRLPIEVKECFADLRAFTVGMLFIQTVYGCIFGLFRALEFFS